MMMKGGRVEPRVIKLVVFQTKITMTLTIRLGPISLLSTTMTGILPKWKARTLMRRKMGSPC